MELLSLISREAAEQHLQRAIDEFAPHKYNASTVNAVCEAYIYSWEIFNRIPDMEDIFEMTFQQIINEIENRWNGSGEQDVACDAVDDFYESEEADNLDVTIIDILDFLALSYTNKYYEINIIHNAAQRKIFQDNELVGNIWKT